MKEDILDTIIKSIELFDNSQKEEAIKLLNTYLSASKKEEFKPEEYDLAMEAYIFLTDGDLRKVGRDFGFTDTEEIRKEIEKL